MRTRPAAVSRYRQWPPAVQNGEWSVHFDPALELGQCELANRVLGRTDCCVADGASPCNVPWFLDEALAKTGNLESMSVGALTATELLERLDRHEIIPIRIAWHGGGGHFQVIAGYHRDSRGGLLAIVHDPERGESHVHLEALTNGQEFEWTHTFRVRAPVEDAETKARLEQLFACICRLSDDDGPIGTGLHVLPDIVLTTREIAQTAAERQVRCRFYTGREWPEPDRHDLEVLSWPIADKAAFSLVRLAEPVPVRFDFSGSMSGDAGLAANARLRILSVDQEGHGIYSTARLSGQSPDRNRLLYKIADFADQTGLAFDYSSGSPIFDANLELIGIHRDVTPSGEYEGVALRGLDNALSSLSGNLLTLASRTAHRVKRRRISDIYVSEVGRQLGYLAAWPPTDSLQLGDIGTVEDGQFKRDSSLRELEIDFAAEEISGLSFLTFRSKGVTQADQPFAGGLRRSISFELRDSVFFDAQDCVASRIANLSSVGNAIMSRYWRRKWNRDQLVVCELVKAGALTVLVSDRARAQAQLILENDQAVAGIESQSGLGFTAIGVSHTTPLFRVGQVSSRFLGQASFAVRSGA
jgi:hypothetical protein